MPRRRERPLLKLNKDVETPNGAIWSWSATDEEVNQVTRGEAWDPEHLLEIGDLIKVSSDHHRPMNLKVVSRTQDVVVVQRT